MMEQPTRAIDMNHRKLSEIKDKDEKRYMIEDAARTMQEMGRISKDPELIDAAKKEKVGLKKLLFSEYKEIRIFE